jgi:hypothetical protein
MVLARSKLRRGNSRKTAQKRRPAKKASPTKRAKAEKVDEKDFVRKALWEATDAHFEVVAPNPAFPLPVDSLEWFMRCRNKDEIERAPYLNTVWKEKSGRIWLESLALGDTIDWIELAYGEERAAASLDLDYSLFDEEWFQSDFNHRFPIVMARIRDYEGVVAAISKSRRVNLEIRRAGSKGMLLFTIAARVDRPKGAGLESLRSAIKKNASALKEAYEAIANLGMAASPSPPPEG